MKCQAYLDYIRFQPCSNCGAPGPCDPHHLKGDFNQSGVGMRCSDLMTMPLCRDCHEAIQEARIHDWKDRQRICLLKTLIKSLESGVIVPGDIGGPLW